ncbi:MAG: xanthine dehydrogenase family protein subunit M [Actinomycetales bacterium]|nr:xanthine dehydrogenase family protein subunit M [Actinomycetales bacterium]
MKPAPFTYQRPSTLAQALTAYAAAPDAKVLAGGQSLIPLLSMRLASIEQLIDINGIDELSSITVDESGVRFGATVRHSELLSHPEVAKVQPLIPAALHHVAHPTIRNRGTTCGSIVHADASGEMPTVFALLDGVLTVQSTRGTRQLSTADLFIGALETSLEHDEIATEVFLPALPVNRGVAFDEIARRHGDYALVGVGAIVGIDDNNSITSVRAGYVSVSEVPAAIDLTEAFPGGVLSDEALAAAGELALTHLEPEADIHATIHYREQLVRVLTKRVVTAAYADAVARRKSSREESS